MNQQTGRKELRRQLTFIDDPVRRLQEMLRHGLVDDARDALTALLELTPIYFQDISRLDSAPRLGVTDGQPKKRHDDGFIICVGHATAGRTDYPRCTFEPDILRRAITTVDPTNLKRDIASWAGPWETNATARAMEQFVPKGHELRRDLERWLLRSWFFDGTSITNNANEAWQERWLGRKIADRRHHFHGDYRWRTLLENDRRQCEIADALTDRLHELGMSDAEIREDFLAWLERFAGHLNPDLIIGIANARILAWPEEVRARRGVTMERVCETAMEWMMGGRPLFHPYIVGRLIDGGMLDACTETDALFRKYAAERLAEGRIGLVSEITTMVGHRFFSENVAWGENPNLQFDLKECAARAFDLAWQKNEFGIAAALVNQFGDDACLDPNLLRERAVHLLTEEGDDEGVEAKLAELIEERKTQIRTAQDLATTTGKPIRLDYSLAFTPRL